jgi:outer membrane lipopolysaccharide assembly protein LptE/RlpB
MLLQPIEGMRLFDRTAGCEFHFRGGTWASPAAPTMPSGGSTIDAQARAVLADLIDSLVASGILRPA